MVEKAYSGDVIEIVKPDASADYHIGDIFVVDFRQSDLGTCDDDLLTTTSEEIIGDEEYIIIEKVNNIHFLKEIKSNYLSKSNTQLLSDFKKESKGEHDFNRFMNIVRRLI